MSPQKPALRLQALNKTHLKSHPSLLPCKASCYKGILSPRQKQNEEVRLIYITEVTEMENQNNTKPEEQKQENEKIGRAHV
jgi:hypothetical protein